MTNKRDPKKKRVTTKEREPAGSAPHFADMGKPTPAGQALVLQRRPAERPLEWTDAELQIIRDQSAKGATESEFRALMAIASVKRLNPLLKQIYFRKQKEYDAAVDGYVERWICMTSIDGLRAIADRTGLYDGQDPAKYFYEEEDAGPGKKPIQLLTAAQVAVYRKDISRPFIGEARYAEFVQLKRDGHPNQMWQKMLHNQLSKCAEALALRKAFPEDCGSLYASEEFGPERDEKPAAAERYGAGGGDRPIEATIEEDRLEKWTAELAKSHSVEAVDDVAVKMGEDRLTAVERKELAARWQARRAAVLKENEAAGRPEAP